MNVKFENTGELEAIITVELTKEDYADKVTKELKEIGKTRQIPGFRKGHIDINQLRKRFGKDVKIKVLNDEAIDAVFKYIEENKLDLLGQPLPAAGHDFNLNDDDVTFAYELGLAPKFDIKLDKSVTLPFYTINVTEQMIDDQDKDMRMRGGEQVVAQEYAERAIVKGSIMQLAEDGSVLADGIQVNDGMVAPFLFKGEANVAAKFEGTKVGDKVVFNPFDTCEGNEAEVAAMLHIERDDVAKANTNFELNIAEFMVHKPAELGQEYYDKVFGADQVHNEEEYRARIKAMIEASLLPNSRQLFVRNTEDYLMDTYGKNMPLPEKFLTRFLVSRETNVTVEAAQETYKASVPGIKWELIESKAAEKMGVKVNEEDLKAAAHNLAVNQLRQYGMGEMAEQMADYYAENMLKDEKQRRHISREAFSGKLFGAINAAVTLDEKHVSLEEFRAIVAELNKTAEPEATAE